MFVVVVVGAVLLAPVRRCWAGPSRSRSCAWEAHERHAVHGLPRFRRTPRATAAAVVSMFVRVSQGNFAESRSILPAPPSLV